jgi:3,4-dihydroxy-2-butanone 4-phosphate synthase
VKPKGITIGSAQDCSITVQFFADPNSLAINFNCPGHIFPLRAQCGEVWKQDGHIKAAIDLTRLAGQQPYGILCEIAFFIHDQKY